MMSEITSAENRQIKEAAALARASARRESGRFLIEGGKLLDEAAHSGIALVQVFADREAPRAVEQAQRLSAQGVNCALVPEKLLAKICEVKTPQGIAAVAAQPAPPSDALRADGRYLLLENVQNPGNVGTMLRTAEAFEMSGVLLCGDCADLWAPKTVRGSMGAAFRVPVLRFAAPAEAASRLRGAGIALYTAQLRAQALRPQELAPRGVCIAIGNEGAGITAELAALADGAVEIPMGGATESLSAPISAAVLMWELFRRDAQ